MGKRYDRAYFDRWYRDPRRRVSGATELRRTVRFVVAATEHVLGRPLRTVLDVGCGEGRWRAPLRRERPHLQYLGIDPSPYVVARFGRRRNVRVGTFADLREVGLDDAYDLVVCHDVLHYVPLGELRRGLRALGPRVGGLAYLAVHAAEDDVAGDLRGFHRRSAATYRRLFAGVGLVAAGLHCWMPAGRAGDLTALATPVR
jgi:SAM-dependent methyltransferase